MKTLQEKFMTQAIKEAKKGFTNNEGGPFGCVIIKDGKIVGKGHNQVLKNNDPTCHGEIQAIRNACKKLKTFDLSGCELITTAKNCAMCYFAAAWANISHIYYGCSCEDTEQIGFRDKKFENVLTSDAYKIIPETQICRDKCLELFDEYKKTNPQNY